MKMCAATSSVAWKLPLGISQFYIAMIFGARTETKTRTTGKKSEYVECEARAPNIVVQPLSAPAARTTQISEGNKDKSSFFLNLCCNISVFMDSTFHLKYTKLLFFLRLFSFCACESWRTRAFDAVVKFASLSNMLNFMMYLFTQNECQNEYIKKYTTHRWDRAVRAMKLHYGREERRKKVRKISTQIITMLESASENVNKLVDIQSMCMRFGWAKWQLQANAVGFSYRKRASYVIRGRKGIHFFLIFNIRV